ATAMKRLNPNIRIVGVEPLRIPSMRLAVHGDVSVHPAVTTIADGINVRRVGAKTMEVCKHLVDDWVAVSEEDICRAILFLLEGEKTVAEGAGAAGVAALLNGSLTHLIQGKRVGTVICGGNIDVNALAQVIECGLVMSGRRMRFSMDVADRPGTLLSLMKHISSFQANVINITHERTQMASFGAARVSMTLDVRDREHGGEIVHFLKEEYNASHLIIENGEDQ
ncbi:pyridoxal-phosphate dependent enzyme, partial [archaeon]